MATDEAKLAAVNDLISLLEEPSTGAQRWGGTSHRGVDKAKAGHTPYRAIQAGKVTGVWHSAMLGNIVEVTGDDIIAYAHVLSPVKLGTEVVQGGTIGKIAEIQDNYASGTVTNGYHQHIAHETRHGGYAAGDVGIDPTQLIAKSLKLAKSRKVILAKRIAKSQKKGKK